MGPVFGRNKRGQARSQTSGRFILGFRHCKRLPDQKGDFARQAVAVTRGAPRAAPIALDRKLPMDSHAVAQHRCAILRDGHLKLRGEGAGLFRVVS